MSRPQTAYPFVDKYLREAAGAVSSDGDLDMEIGITEVIETCVEKLSVSRSTVNRWRKDDRVSSIENALSIIIAINRVRSEGKKCNLKDMAALCNYKNMYRKNNDEEHLEDNV